MSRDDDLVLPIDRHLRVVALLESLAAGLHDLALGIGEIALRLRLGLAVGPLVGPPAPGIAVLPRLAPALIVAPALRRLQTRFGCLDRRQAILPALQLLGQLVAPEILAPTLVFFGVHHPAPSSEAPRSPPASELPLCPSAHSSSPCACSRSLAPSSRRPRACRTAPVPSRAPPAPPPQTVRRTPPDVGGGTHIPCDVAGSCPPRASETLHPPPASCHRREENVLVA